jgi:hypothetical protein
MAKGGRRYTLVVYTHMMNRWWGPVFALGLALIGLGWVLRWWGFEEWRWFTMGALGMVITFIGLFMLTIRKSAYVQPFPDHLRMVTPFLRMNISYKRVRRATSSSMAQLFPLNSMSNWRADMIEPLAKLTAIILDLNALPIPMATLKFFLSPLFFKDKTPHIVLLVDDWMKFSSELESMRSGQVEAAPQKRGSDNSILTKLPRK